MVDNPNKNVNPQGKGKRSSSDTAVAEATGNVLLQHENKVTNATKPKEYASNPVASMKNAGVLMSQGDITTKQTQQELLGNGRSKKIGPENAQDSELPAHANNGVSVQETNPVNNKINEETKADSPTTTPKIEQVKRDTGDPLVELFQMGDRKFEIRYGGARQHILSNSVGRMFSVLMHTIITGKPWQGLQDMKPEDIHDILERASGHKWNDDHTVYVGHTDRGDQIKKLLKEKRTFWGKLAYLVDIPVTVLNGLNANLTRADHYNGLTKSVSIYSPLKWILAHELGHAKHFDREWDTGEIMKILSPFVGQLYTENEATQFAYSLTNDLKEKRAAEKVLIPAFGSYVGGAIVKVGLLFALVTNPANWTWSFRSFYRKVMMLGPLAGIAGGHIRARVKGLFGRGKDREQGGAETKKKKGFFGRLFGRKRKSESSGEEKRGFWRRVFGRKENKSTEPETQDIKQQKLDAQTQKMDEDTLSNKEQHEQEKKQEKRQEAKLIQMNPQNAPPPEDTSPGKVVDIASKRQVREKTSQEYTEEYKRTA